MWTEKLGNYLIDVSKYVLTGVVIASIFKDLGESKLLLYGIGFASASLVLVIGLVLTNKKKEEK
ncbi:hypothetical protein FACS1894162_5230 [Bacteroidia bacterium]|nr:hypothetical protein FACS1894162_5230 [Bacteroidia bacterium]